jgi:hypothetical protein
MPDPQRAPISEERRVAVRERLIELLSRHDPSITQSTEVFQYKFVSPTGTVTLQFEPGNGFIDWAIRTSDRVTSATIKNATETLVREGKLPPEVPEQAEVKAVFDENAPDDAAVWLAYVAMRSLIPKMISAFIELGIESAKMMESLVIMAMERGGFDKATGYQLPNIKTSMEQLSKDFANTRKAVLFKQISVLAGEPQLDYLPILYPQLLVIWQDVKKIYTANKETEKWRVMVKAKYDDVPFDDDLLTRISTKPENLPEDIQEKVAESDGDQTPSSIALEHSARLCGCTPYQFGTRHLFTLARKGKPKTERRKLKPVQ